LLDETGLPSACPIEVSMDSNCKLLKDEAKLFEDSARYHRLIGKLNHLTIIRPYISYVVSVISQFLEDPQVSHWEPITRIIWYLKKAPSLGILYKQNEHLKVEGFTKQIGLILLQIDGLLQDIVHS
jgi:hypothetical protein